MSICNAVGIAPYEGTADRNFVGEGFYPSRPINESAPIKRRAGQSPAPTTEHRTLFAYHAAGHIDPALQNVTVFP